MKGRPLCIAAALFLVAGAGAVQAGEVEIDWTYSGSYIDSVVDFDLDDSRANETHVWTKGSPGPASINGLFELDVIGPTEACPAPLLGTAFEYHTWVGRFPNGDLIFARSTGVDGGCIDPINGVSTGVTHFAIMGGTGKYRGATGSYDDYFTVVYLLQSGDPFNPVPFAAVFGRAEGVIYTADE